MCEDAELKRVNDGRELVAGGTHSCWDGRGGPEALQGSQNIYSNLIWKKLRCGHRSPGSSQRILTLCKTAS